MERTDATCNLDIGRSALLTDLAMCVNHYRLSSPGLYCCVHAPVQLDAETRLRPGILAMVNHGGNKQCAPDADYQAFHGPPNFIIDVFPADDWLDYESRKRSFERAGVIEYVAFRDSQPLSWEWNRRNEHGKFEMVDADHEDLILSAALPGFWAAKQALADRDWWAIMATTSRGVTRRRHHEYMDAIWRPDNADAAS